MKHNLSTQEGCVKLLINVRWGKKPFCPHCGSKKVYVTNRGFICVPKKADGCAKKFTVTANTIFHHTNLPLTKWLSAISLLTQKPLTVSELAVNLDLTQKTSWHIFERIKKCFIPNGKIPNREYSESIKLELSFEDALKVCVEIILPCDGMITVSHTRVNKTTWQWSPEKRARAKGSRTKK